MPAACGVLESGQSRMTSARRLGLTSGGESGGDTACGAKVRSERFGSPVSPRRRKCYLDYLDNSAPSPARDGLDSPPTLRFKRG